MAGAIVTWLALIVCAGALFVWKQAAAGFLLGLTALAAALVSVVLTALMKKAVSVQLEKPDDVQSGQETALVCRVRNRSVLPVLRLRLRLVIENELTGQTLRQTVFVQAGSRTERAARAAFCSRYCGSIRVSAARAELFDFFGLAAFRLPCGQAQRFLVLPDIFEPELRLPICMSSSADSDAYSPLRPGFDYSETFQVRPYAEGDSPKQVHWKLTSKLDELIVRDPSLPIERTALVLWDRTARNGQTPAQTDALARVLLSVCIQLLRQGVSCKIAWSRAEDDGCMQYELRQSDELYALLSSLLRAHGGAGTADGTEQYLRLYGRQSSGKVLYFSASPSEYLPELCPQEQLVSFLCTNADSGGCGRVYTVEPERCEEELFEIDLY